MSEFALLTGLNYLSSNIKSKENNIINNTNINDKILLDDYKYSQYNSNIVLNTNNNIKKLYEDRKKDTMDPKKFMIPIYYNLQTQNQDTGSGTNIYNGPEVETFNDQFELAKFNNKSVVPQNDIPINDKNTASIQNKLARQNDWSIFTTDSQPTQDMTYHVIAKDDKSFVHNNMNAFNRMRDMDTPELRDSRKL